MERKAWKDRATGAACWRSADVCGILWVGGLETIVLANCGELLFWQSVCLNVCM
jgi:hypothetical protein